MSLYTINTFNQNFFHLKHSAYVIGESLLETSCTLQSKKHIHNNLELLFIVAGTGHVFLNNRKYQVKKGDLVVINPGIIHCEGFDQFEHFGESLKLYSCELKELEVAPLSPEHLLPSNYTPIIPTSEMYGNFKNLFAQIHELRMQSEVWYEQMCNNLSDEIILLILRILNSSDFVCTKSYQPSEMSKILQYIDAHFCEDINTTSIANHLNMSRHTLLRIFQNYQDSSPSQYIRKKRLEMAVRLISDSDESLQDIASKTGFSSYQQFYKTFTNYYGTSPSDYLKTISSMSETIHDLLLAPSSHGQFL